MDWELNPSTGVLRWRLHLGEAPETVYRFLATDVGRESFWAESAKESPSGIDWQFASGENGLGSVLEHTEPSRYAVELPEGSVAEFDLESDGRTGTDLTLTLRKVRSPQQGAATVSAVSMLMRLKAVVDHGVDLRTHEADRTWERGFIEE